MGGQSGSAHRVLVIDDERTIAELIRDVLVHRGFAAATSPGGQSSLEEAVRGNYRLVISDYAIPGMNGLEFVRRFRQLKPESSVLIVSAFLDGETIDELRAVGNVIGLIRKPFDIFDLARRVERYFGVGAADVGATAAAPVAASPALSAAPRGVNSTAGARVAVSARPPFHLEGM